MVVDTMLFNNEFDMLDMRLAITSSYVDRWVVLEASRTFSGIVKPYYLTERLQQYRAQWGDRISTVCLPLDETQTNLVCETMMRRALQPAIDQYHDDDIILHGDLDEVVNPEHWHAIVDLMDQHDRPVSCGMEMFVYRFDQRAHRGWKGTVVARKRMFPTPHELYKGQNIKRKDRSHCVGFKHPVGWHWTWMGSDDAIRHKVIACIESQHRDPEQVLGAFKAQDSAAAINHKCTSEIVTVDYPTSVLNVLTKYPAWWHRPPK